MNISVTIEGQEVFTQRVGKFADALSSPFLEMDMADPLHRDFLEIEEDHFQSGGHGRWDDLSDAYEERKTKETGSVHFLMQFSRRLYFSLTRDKDDDHIFDKSNPNELVFGSRVPYARAHMKPYKGRPARPPIDLRAEDVRKMQKTIRKQAAIFNRQKVGFIETEVGEVG